MTPVLDHAPASHALIDHAPVDHRAADAPPALTGSRRQDGWSAPNQRRFLEAIAEGAGVESAAARCGLSAASAYAFRRTARGAAFALGWRAACLVAREGVADMLMARAVDGQIDTVHRPDGSIVTRHRRDNRLGLALLARLDRQVETAPDADVRAARLVAQEFDAFLGLVDRDEGPARAGLFLARRCGALVPDDGGADEPDLAPILALATADRLARTGVATAGEIDVADLDPAARATWTAEQWARAEAAGLVALAAPCPAAPGETASGSQLSQHPPAAPDTDTDAAPDTDAEDDDPPVWWDDHADEWRTSFPPPPGFDGFVSGTFGHPDYERGLSPGEEAAIGDGTIPYTAADLAELATRRDAWFAATAAQRGLVFAEPAAASPDDDRDDDYDPDDWSAYAPGRDLSATRPETLETGVRAPAADPHPGGAGRDEGCAGAAAGLDRPPPWRWTASRPEPEHAADRSRPCPSIRSLAPDLPGLVRTDSQSPGSGPI